MLEGRSNDDKGVTRSLGPSGSLVVGSTVVSGTYTFQEDLLSLMEKGLDETGFVSGSKDLCSNGRRVVRTLPLS